MKKVIELTEQVEKSLVSIFHEALRAGGYQIKSAIDLVERSVKTQEEEEK